MPDAPEQRTVITPWYASLTGISMIFLGGAVAGVFLAGNFIWPLSQADKVVYDKIWNAWLTKRIYDAIRITIR
jgi:hypothetical protein